MEKAKIIFLGDVSFSGQNKTNPFFVDDELRKIFKSADAVICNFESTFTEEDKPGLFQSPSARAGWLKQAGITHAIIANNHIYDYGYEALENTVSVLKNAGVEPLGLKRLNGLDQGVASLKLNGVNIGLICCGWTRAIQNMESPNVYWEYNEEEIAAKVQQMSQEFDHLMVVCHRGKMFVEYPSPTDKKAFHSYIDLGASAVIAHHPHVAQGVSYTNNKLVAYSLGNFYFDSTEGHIQSKYSKNKQDLGLTVTVELDKQRLLGHELIFVRRTDTGVTKLDSVESLSAMNHLKKLSNNTGKAIIGRACFYWQYLRNVVPHFLRVLLHHRLRH